MLTFWWLFLTFSLSQLSIFLSSTPPLPSSMFRKMNVTSFPPLLLFSCTPEIYYSCEKWKQYLISNSISFFCVFASAWRHLQCAFDCQVNFKVHPFLCWQLFFFCIYTCFFKFLYLLLNDSHVNHTETVYGLNWSRHL